MDYNAPQFVNFLGDSFQRDIGSPSELSEEDSLNATKCNSTCEDLEQSSTHNSTDEIKDASQPEEMESMDNVNPSISSFISEGSDEYGHAKENYIVYKNTIVSNKNKCVSTKTIPEPFHFRTSNRMRNRFTDSNIVLKEQDFASQLRQNTDMQYKKPKATTVKPFHLTESKKRKHPENEFKSLAEQALEFQKKTPQRYHTSQKAFEPQEHWVPSHLTAKSPNLQALKRRRVIKALSKEQQEEKEVEEMKAHEFHARPVNPKIYKRPSTNTLQMKAMLKTKKFYLKTAQRVLQHKRKSLEKPYRFKARPVPAKILKGPTGLKEKPVLPSTEPKSPKFSSEDRLEKRRQMQVHKEEVKETSMKMQKHPNPPPPPPPPSVPWTKRRTEICPFSFDSADKERYLKKEKKIQEEIENERRAHEFYATLMPCPAAPVLPVVAKKPPTKPEPFNFKLNDRSSKQFSFTSEKSITFKAQPAKVLKEKPFIPEKPPKEPIEIQEFNLHTNKRASERQQLKQLKETKEQEMQQAYLIRKAHEEKLEREELMRFRKEIVHKANPVRHYKPVEIKPGLLPLTTPQTPDFETEKRLQSRHSGRSNS